MITLLLAVILFFAAVLLMCLGALLGGRRIEGSCGGLERLTGIESDCAGACSGRPCPEKRRSCRAQASADNSRP